MDAGNKKEKFFGVQACYQAGVVHYVRGLPFNFIMFFITNLPSPISMFSYIFGLRPIENTVLPGQVCKKWCKPILMYKNTKFEFLRKLIFSVPGHVLGTMDPATTEPTEQRAELRGNFHYVRSLLNINKEKIWIKKLPNW